MKGILYDMDKNVIKFPQQSEVDRQFIDLEKQKEEIEKQRKIIEENKKE